MKTIAFIDSEIDPKTLKVIDIGGIKDNSNTFHSNSMAAFINFLKDTQFICGHNIIQHDLNYIQNTLNDAGINTSEIIDTLYLSPLLFPSKPYHALLKDDKLQTEYSNNPLNDSMKAKDLFFDEVATFNKTDETLKQIFYLLLNTKAEFQSFFNFVDYSIGDVNTEVLIRDKFHAEICKQTDLKKIMLKYPIELAYCLALINSRNRYSITPPWVMKNYPKVERIMFLLRNNPCMTDCIYCNDTLDIHKCLKKYFKFDSFKTYAGEPLQENAVKAAVNNKSLLAVFPTGGGKSITFQLPALISGESIKGLTVVISPLQSLMKDQVDNLEKAGITDAVTINGLLDPIEKGKSFERVADGSATLLYISPESLRSRTIEKLLSGRKIARFVIDEAHCLSTWGQDFRVDYLYIGDFINTLQHNKNSDDKIPVSCFTATAKQKVIEDICSYFKEKLSLELEIFTSKVSRTNLHYKVIEKGNEEEKYNTMRDLIEEKNCPAIIYVSRTRKAYQLAERLTLDGFNAKPYHGKMNTKEKTENQNAFVSGNVQIMVATSAFGMGVDKKDIGLIIHFEISDSLENYIQEAGRAGRDENITADCYILFNEDDLNKHFILLNQSKLNIHEIKQIWNAIKFASRSRPSVSISALEIARKAGWDDNIIEIETRVKTAIAALENAGYLKRGQNMPRIFANSILTKTAQEAIEKIENSTKFADENHKINAIRIIKKLFSSKSRKQISDESAESRIDYISDQLGLEIHGVIKAVTILREEGILADAKDLSAFIRRGEIKNRSLAIVKTFSQIENFLLHFFEEQEKSLHLKELNELAEKRGYNDVSLKIIKTILNFWAIKHWIKKHNKYSSSNYIVGICCQSKKDIKEKLNRMHELAEVIIDYLFQKISTNGTDKEEVLVEFSVLELKEKLNAQTSLFDLNVTIEDIENTLFYLSRIEAIKIEGGFLVVYNKLTIDRIVLTNKLQYKAEDYKKLNQYYENKVQQIHIVGEYAKKMMDDPERALQFVDDYFHLNYFSFLQKYFPGSRESEIKKNITPGKYRELFDTLSITQRKIIDDKLSKYIVVAAGPGSGKTKVLVHKLASLLLMEDVKHEQLLMVTFSRAAATEFKKRLIQLIGNAALYISIKTFHAYCFDLLGKVGSIEKSDLILKSAIKKIKNNEVEVSRITKAVIVIDEAQDMDEDEFNLISLLIEKNEEMRVIAVGDDDQCIYSFRKANPKYLQQFITGKQATKYELITNFRSKNNLVSFTNQFVQSIQFRLKKIPIAAHDTTNGNIRIVHYENGNLITPLINDLLQTDLSGTTCVLTKTNEEASQITGLLLKNGIQAKLIQSNDGFSLHNLLEIRFFLNLLNMEDEVYIIDDEVWSNAKRELANKFSQSSKLEVCQEIIQDFEATNPKKKYKSDLEAFVRESKLEDFFSENGELIYVSTIHKSKGKEFSNVFILLENFHPETDETKRQLYVAMTRAKQNLTIHLNGNYLDNINTENLQRIENHETHILQKEMAMHLTFKDVYLDYFISRQHLISKISSGDVMSINGDTCTNALGKPLLKFSKNFLYEIETKRQAGYILKEAKVNFIVYWQKEDSGQEIKIILPELYFQR